MCMCMIDLASQSHTHIVILFATWCLRWWYVNKQSYIYTWHLYQDVADDTR